MKSDVGVNLRGQRSRSPPERETFSEVGVGVAPPRSAGAGGFILHQQVG